MLSVQGLRVRYGAIEVLHGIDIEVEAGSIVSLVGGNGAGKTTLLRALSGLLPIHGGEVIFDGRSIGGRPANAIVQLGLAHVPEGRGIFGELSVEDNLRVGAYSRRRTGGAKAMTAQMMELFPRLGERRKQKGATLSGGEQQMLAFARAMMSRPRMLLLDEPSLGLAPKIVDEIARAVRRFNDEGATILLVEQNAQLALSMSRHAYVLDLGHVVMRGSSESLLHDERVRSAYLGIEATG